MSIRVRRSLAVVALAVVASACGSDSSVAPASNQRTDLNQVFAELWSSALGNAVSTPRVGMAGPALPIIVPSSCPYAAASKSFQCPARTAGGVTITQSYALLDASGAPQAAFDATTTAAVRVSSTIAGTTTIASSSMKIQAEDSRTLSGLLTGTHTLNGTSTSHLVATLPGTAGNGFDNTLKMTMVDVVLPATIANPSTPAWPTSGTVTVQHTGTLPGFPDLVTTSVLTFNGTSKVSITIDDNGLPLQHCTFDLSTSAFACA